MRFQDFTNIILVLVLVWLVVGLLWWRVYRRVGWNGQTGLLMLVPIINIGLFIYFAVVGWPIERELKQLRARLGSPPSGPPGSP